MIFVVNTFSMRQKPHIGAGQQVRKMEKILEQKKLRSELRSELIAANWSQEKIKEIRERRDPSKKSRLLPGGEFKYGALYSYGASESPTAKMFNDLLIDHYAQKIREALRAIPLDERATWASNFRLILSIKLENFVKKDGVKKYYAGLLPTIVRENDGSEIGIAGTKFRAMEKVKDETDDFATIPFDGSLQKITPEEFFKSLAYDATPQTGVEVEQQKKSGLTSQQRETLEQEWEEIDI